MEMLWVRVFRDRRIVRELLHTADEGWTVAQRSEALPGEDTSHVRRILRREEFVAGDDGYELVGALVTGDDGELLVGEAEELSPALPARVHGDFQSALALPSGRVLVGGERRWAGWASLSAQLVDEQGRVSHVRNVEGRLMKGEVVGLTSEELIVTFARIDPHKGELYCFRETPEGFASLTKNPKRLAVGSLVEVLGGCLYVVEGRELRSLSSKGRARWKRAISHRVDALEALENGGIVATRDRDKTYLDADGNDIEPASTIAARPRHEVQTDTGVYRLDDEFLHFTDHDANRESWSRQGITELGPSVGAHLFVKSSLGTWGETYWSMSAPSA